MWLSAKTTFIKFQTMYVLWLLGLSTALLTEL